MTDGPVKWQAPDDKAPVVDPKTGKWTPAGHRWALSAFYRSGGYDDAVWLSTVSIGGLQAQVRSAQARIAAEAVRAQADKAEAAGVRSTARRAEGKADAALIAAAVGAATAKDRSAGARLRALEKGLLLLEARVAAAVSEAERREVLRRRSEVEGQVAGVLREARAAVLARKGIETAFDSLTTSDVPEGSNLYFSNGRARSAVSASGSLSYNPTTGVLSFTDAVTSVAGQTGAVTLNTDDVSEASSQYFTSGRARDAVEAFITPAASINPPNNGDLVIEATSNTSLTLKLKGSDGNIRSVVLTLT